VEQTTSPSTRLRGLLGERVPAIVPGCGDALSARLIEAAGFRATCVSGAWAAALRGFTDNGLITLPEMAESARHVANAVSIPVLADVDTGFGGALNVRRCVREFESAGVASIQIEDQGEPKRCGLMQDKIIVSEEDMVTKVRAAESSRRSDLLILARTDALASEGLDATIARGKAYLGAGADALFVEAIRTREEAQRIGDAFSDAYLVFNLAPSGFSEPVSIEELADWGYGLVYFSTQVLLSALHTQRRLLRELASTGACSSFEQDMLSIQEFFDLLPTPGPPERSS
jgi:2-methylisocitrate lyase-like PEP mutase family enzyme